MRLVLVRHGRTPSNVHRLLDTAPPGAGLDEAGLEQASALVSRLAGHPLEAVYASTATRALQTAAPMADARGLDVGVVPGVREIAAGDQELWPHWERYVGMLRQWAGGDLSVSRPGGESGVEFFQRFDAAVDAIAAPGHEAAMVVSHGAALRMWVGGRVDGVGRTTVAHRPLGNTGFIVIEGDPRSGWEFVTWDSGVEIEPHGPDRVPGRYPVDPDDAVRTAQGWHVGARELSLETQWSSDAAAADFVARVGRLADELDHHPDLELGPASVRLILTSHDVGAVTHRDTAFARLVSSLVADLGGAAAS